ncbi:MAG: hypothetical protein KJ946_15350, partial [Gammaproteobacteria bacterium]|nr:hypothetical protein [Gammaproteobacteria bacterium]
MTNEDQADLLEMVYGNNLPDIIKSGQVDSSVFSLDRLTEMGITTDRIGQWVANGEITQDTADALLAQLGDTMARGAQAEADVNATPNPTNKMMGILSEALNAKNNFKNQKLGTSDLFAMAGLSGYAVLAQSLAQRGNEMKQKSMSAANVISSVGGAMAENYKAVTDNYNRLAEQYDKQVDRLLKIDEQAKDHEFALDEINARLEADKKLAQFEFNLDQKE